MIVVLEYKPFVFRKSSRLLLCLLGSGNRIGGKYYTTTFVRFLFSDCSLCIVKVSNTFTLINFVKCNCS